MKVGPYELNVVHCADSFQAIKNIPDNSIDCIYTDIPYLYESGGKGTSPLGQRIARLNYEEITEIRKGIDYSIFYEMIRVMKAINIFIWCSRQQIFEIQKIFAERDCICDLLVWCKSNPTPQTNNTWLSDVEYCLYFREKGKVHFNDGYELKSKWYISPINKHDKDLFGHPTMKPLELVKRHLLHTTQPNDIVADFFTGGGTTPVACKDIGRNSLCFEIEQKWVDVSNNRLLGIDANGQMSFLLR